MKQRKLNFRYNIGDAILLSDGRRGIITRYGIYDDQYWCEIADAHGINLCFADWFFARGCAPTIMQRLPSENRTCQSYRWKQAAICESREPLEAIRSAKTRPEEWRVVPMGDSAAEN